MDKKIRIAAIVAAVAISIIIITSPSEPPPIPEPTIYTQNESVEILATNLEKPHSITFADDRIFVTEKIGKIRVIQNDVLLDEPLATFRTADVFGGGLLGIETHPQFSKNHALYVYFTYEQDNNLWNKVMRLTESENKLVDAVTIIDNIPGAKFSNGGVIKFGPDNKLYVSTGAVSDSLHLSQDIESLAGKILRLNDDGTIPTDNPFPNSPVYSFGLRNPQGLSWDTQGNLYVADQGPTKNDEINLIEAGENYGWPDQECSGNAKFEDALICFDPEIEPGGIIVYTSDVLPLNNKLIMSTLRGSNLYQFEIKNDELSSQQSILGGIGRIRDVNQGPDGYLYIITSNTDGKGFPDSNDDKLLRILR